MRALTEQHRELEGVLTGLDADAWVRPVPGCPGWSVADVVLHLAQTDELVVASVERGFAAAAGIADGPVDDMVGQLVERERGASGPSILERWRAASTAARALLAGSDPRRPLPWVVTDLPARTMATTRLSECWIHTNDVADAVGVALTPGDRLWHIARLAVRTVPYAFTRAGLPDPGPVAARLTAPDGAPWEFGPPDAPTTITGPALDFCLVAARRLDPAASALTATGPAAPDVLRFVRTYA